MAQKHILSSCFALIPFTAYPLSLFLALFITSLTFLWYRSSRNSGSWNNHSTPHSNKRRSDKTQDILSVLKKPTTTSTVATTYITSSAVTRVDTAPIPRSRNETQQQSSMKGEQHQAAWTCQPYDAFLVLDVEATCLQGTGFHWPNEIIVSYRIKMRSHRSVEYRNGQFVSLSGRTGDPMEWSVPCKKSQNFAALLNQLGAPSYLHSVSLSLG
jgi:hypothetical protein